MAFPSILPCIIPAFFSSLRCCDTVGCASGKTSTISLQINKRFIDCGGVMRDEKAINFQLWFSTDNDHRLEAEKLKKIIALSEDKLGLEDVEIEVEYQQSTIGKFGLEFNGSEFVLTTKTTTCLAQDACGIPQEKPRVKLSELQSASCAPGSGCC
jgi:hypothetical protein